MKVLLIDVNCKNSSTGNIVYNLYNYINSSGDEAAVCYGRGPKIEEKNIFKFSEKLGVKYILNGYNICTEIVAYPAS